MAYESRIEDIITDVKEYFEDNIDTYLNGIETLKNDSILVPNFLEVVLDDIDIYNCAKYPICMFDPTEIIIEPLSKGSDLLQISFNIVIVITGGKRSNITTQIMRYVDGVRQLFAAEPTCGNAVDETDENIKVQIFPSLPGDTEKKTAVVTVTVRKSVGR